MTLYFFLSLFGVQPFARRAAQWTAFKHRVVVFLFFVFAGIGISVQTLTVV